MRIQLTVNGKARRADVPPMKRLLDVLREDLRLTGTKEGCGEGECGACTVLLDGEVVNSCLVPAGQADGATITTIEGIDHPMQHAFCELGGAQCGICTPGMIVSAVGYVARWRAEGHRGLPTRGALREALAGNLCRCTGYEKVLDSVIDGVRRADAAAKKPAAAAAAPKKTVAPRKTAAAPKKAAPKKAAAKGAGRASGAPRRRRAA